ncbi:MAG: methyltransferase domain-containing protein [Oryzihumus sp.]
MTGGWRTRDSYDGVASPYAELTRCALDRLPFERSALGLFAQRVLDAGGGPVVDAGCGPGWLTGHLARQGLDITGVDVSTGFLEIARSAVCCATPGSRSTPRPRSTRTS